MTSGPWIPQDLKENALQIARARYINACREYRQAFTIFDEAKREMTDAREALKDALLRED